MWVAARFTENNVSVSGLSPLIKIRNVATGAYVVNNESMSEVGDGFYRYSFDSYNPDQDYVILCDSVTLSGADRYSYTSSGEYGDVLNDNAVTLSGINTVVTAINSTVTDIDVRTLLLKQIQTNKLVLQDGSTNNWILYQDDGVTPLLTFSVTDKDGQSIVQQSSVPSRRSKATE